VKISDVIAMVNSGIQSISSRTLDIGDAYIVVKFKSLLKKVFDEYAIEEQSMFKEAGIQDPQSFFQKHRALQSKINKDAIDEGLLADNNSKIERFNALQTEAQKKVVDLGLTNRLSFDSWHRLQDANKDIKTNYGAELLSLFEVDLEGVLWEMKEEKKEKANPKA